MVTRVLVVLALLASPAAAELITISEGVYDRINLNPDRELLMTGGRIEYLHNIGGKADINGGVIVLGVAKPAIDGSETKPDITFTGGAASVLSSYGATVKIHGYHFWMSHGRVTNSSASYNIQGFMLDGGYGGAGLIRFGSWYDSHFEVITHEPTFLDPDRDWDFDLEDLNFLRNNFGATTDEGDTNFDGMIDLADLNLVRNHFGEGVGMLPEYQFSGVINLNPDTSAVPEPASLLLGLLLLVTTALPRIFRR